MEPFHMAALETVVKISGSPYLCLCAPGPPPYLTAMSVFHSLGGMSASWGASFKPGHSRLVIIEALSGRRVLGCSKNSQGPPWQPSNSGQSRSDISWNFHYINIIVVRTKHGTLICFTEFICTTHSAFMKQAAWNGWTYSQETVPW